MLWHNVYQKRKTLICLIRIFPSHMLGATINSSLINVTNDTITTSILCVDNPSYPEREVAPSAVGWHTLQLLQQCFCPLKNANFHCRCVSNQRSFTFWPGETSGIVLQTKQQRKKQVLTNGLFTQTAWDRRLTLAPFDRNDAEITPIWRHSQVK